MNVLLHKIVESRGANDRSYQGLSRLATIENDTQTCVQRGDKLINLMV